MNIEKFEELGRIKRNMSDLSCHVDEIHRVCGKGEECVEILVRRKNSCGYYPIMMDDFLPKNFIEDYCNKVKEEIERLEKEFESL